MNTFLTILACFAGVFAFAFSMAGLLGLMSFESPSKKGDILWSLLDHTFTGGAFTAIGDIARNWQSRASERRLLYAGLACGVACITLVVVIRRIS